MRRELKVKELQFLDASRRRFLKYQQDQRQMELKRLDDEIARKAEYCSSNSFLEGLFRKITKKKFRTKISVDIL